MRGRAVVLPGIDSRCGSCVLDHPGRAVVLPVIFSSFGSPVLDLPLPPPKRRGFRAARYCRWIVLVRVARFFHGEPIARTEPDHAQAHFFPHAIPTSPRKVPATVQFPSFRRGQGVVAARSCQLPSLFPPKRMQVGGGRRAFPPTPKSIPAKTDAPPGWSAPSRLRREPSSLLPLLTLFNHRNPLFHSKIQKRATLYIKYVYYIKKICTFAA